MNRDLQWFADELRKIRAEEEARFDKKLSDAIGAWKFKNVSCLVAAFGVVLAASFAIPPIVRNIVQDKVRCEFESYTQKKINEEIVKLSDALGDRLQKSDNQLKLFECFWRSIAGSVNEYEFLKKASLSDDTAMMLLNAVDSYYVSSMFRRGDDYCTDELAWGCQKLSSTNEELVKIVMQASEVTPEIVNALINLAQRDNSFQYVHLFIDTASRCNDLNCRKDIVDCICALSHDCPRTIDVTKIDAWWKQKTKPDHNLQ